MVAAQEGREKIVNQIKPERPTVKLEVADLDTYQLKHILDSVPSGMVLLHGSLTFVDPGEVPEEPVKTGAALNPARGGVTASPHYPKPTRP